MATLPNAPHDTAPEISDAVAPGLGLTDAAEGAMPGDGQRVDQPERGLSLLSRAAQPLQRRSLFRR